MQYPSCVHRDGDTGFRASFPNFPGAAAHGNSMDELKVDAQEAVELAYDRSEQLIPTTTCSTSELHVLDMDDGEGIWTLVDINCARVTSQAVGIQFNLLESLLQQVDLAARGRHITRAALITLAVVHELASRYEGHLSSMPVSQRVFVDG
ncbi:type II toxin-antitoxin system HicB family antitoxin [Paraburkholderia edwinii]|uniref:Type II toxin-antitoxin system HicB family antitoxin n=1 Tax=Paraburkholderia edwinii TaxID=2861782 RepID=A0ABX8ULS3_9BURK|nr:type II toxin-antitoxin system HicB family antitoxin [Paraburkholderia edwinii]QYD67913.1 type II toxin-antitoxin system HicB family antitoxin [Paraburkholderia edwinii]